MSASTSNTKLSREDFRKQKDLDAARKAGTAPAALDEEGKPINPHIPQYISQAPWYLDTGAPSLSHQRRAPDEPKTIDNWYDRGLKAGPAAKKYRKGACENCGAMTHKRNDCIERPRRRGAKFTNHDIQADEVVQDVATGYAAKRDRWNGYDTAEHTKVYEEYAAIDAARQKQRELEIDNQTTTDLAAVRKVAKAGKADGDADFGSSDEEDEDEDKYADTADAVGQKLDTKTRITVRNLRIREDTAKYLINLDPESAYYDPKTRSMRDAPVKNVAPEDAKFAGDNFLRASGEAQDMQKLQLFAWQSASRGNDVHLNANPTQGELLHQEFKQKTEELRDTSKISILAKYGGAKYLQTAPKELLQGQTEEYVEYSRGGQLIKGRERAKAKSKYPEDVYVNNHTQVWGSWYDSATSTWGYACCHSTVHLSYCAGQAVPHKNLPPPPVREPEEHDRERADQNFGKKRVGEGDVQIDEERLARALKEEKKRKAGAEDDVDRYGKKRKGVASSTHEVTEEELEAYRMTRRMTEDPMANYIDQDMYLALIVGLGGRLLLDQLTRTGAAPTTREFVVLGLWMGSGLHYVSTSSRELLVPAGAVVGVKLFSDFVFQESARVLICVLGIGLGFCFADLVSRWMEGGGESSRPSSRARERDRDKEKRDAQRRVSSRTRRSEGDERRSPRRQSSRRAVSDITSVDANSFAYERDSATMRTPLDREIAALRARASLADSERRRYKEERKWALDDGNEARAKEMSWQYKRYSALMKSFHREADELQMSVASGARPERPLDDSMLLPTEVAEQVIDACDGSDTRTLASCTLVCRSWHNRAAFRLFARPLRVVGIPDLEAFVATLRSPICTIHDLIRSLSVQQSSRNPS
ncbi:Slu7 domain-containing protein [Mycena kentingensis (nom. inval.)]|nr:Slu7 domain-containing protein [Mycena kentingensis (nom. inval.)]